jgi:hypothetical protein
MMRVVVSGCACALAVVAAGCLGACGILAGGSAGTLRAQSLGDDPAVLQSNFTNAFFSHDPARGISFMLSDVPIDQLMKGTVNRGQIMHIDLLWMPKAGVTPLDSSATNATIRYVIISKGEIGVYGGAGFAMPQGDPLGKSLSITLRDASLQLQESTAGFHDVLSPAQLTGTISAKRDDRKTTQINYAASQLVTNALGKTKYVANW